MERGDRAERERRVLIFHFVFTFDRNRKKKIWHENVSRNANIKMSYVENKFMMRRSFFSNINGAFSEFAMWKKNPHFFATLHISQMG